MPVAGRPCIAWTILTAKSAGSLACCVVSTDDPEIAAVARAHDTPVVRRPAELASDTARVDDAARQALDAIEHGENEIAGLATSGTQQVSASTPIVILYGNVPVRPEGCIDRAVGLLIASGADSVQTYQPSGKHHPWWTARVDVESGQVRPWEGDVLNHGVFRRQDLPAACVPDGAVLVTTARALRLEIPGVRPGPHAFFGVDRRGIVNPEGSVVDIDSRYDLLVADAMLRDRAAMNNDG